jgi:hypothetical protein
MIKRPPRFAAWLLSHFGPPEEFLAGDLIERFQEWQSSSWYWRQAILGIAHYWRTELRQCKSELVHGWAAWSLLVVSFNIFSVAMVASRGSGGLITFLVWVLGVLAMRQAGKRIPRQLGPFLVVKTLYMLVLLRTLDFYDPSRADLSADLAVLSIAPVLQFVWNRVRFRHAT